MRILVTGAAGFLGRRVVQELRGKGHEVIALARSRGGRTADSALKAAGAELLQRDLREHDLRNLLPTGVEALVSLAQSAHFRDFPSHAEDIFDVNVGANLRLLHWAAETHVPKFLLVSSGGVRMLEGATTGDRLGASAPLDFYLATKLAAELALCAFRDRLRAAIVVRPFFIYGPGQRRDMLIPRLIDSVANSRPIRLEGPDGLRATPVYVQDMAAAVCAALAGDGHAIYDVGGPDVLTLRLICEKIGRSLGREPVFERFDAQPGNFVADRSAFCARFDIPWTRFDEGLALTMGHNTANALEY